VPGCLRRRCRKRESLTRQSYLNVLRPLDRLDDARLGSTRTRSDLGRARAGQVAPKRVRR